MLPRLRVVSKVKEGGVVLSRSVSKVWGSFIITLLSQGPEAIVHLTQERIIFFLTSELRTTEEGCAQANIIQSHIKKKMEIL